MKTKSIIYLAGLFILLFFFNACDDNEPEIDASLGTFSLQFDHKVGDNALVLKDAGSTDYNYTTESGQQFNVSLFGYYVSKIKLEGPNGELFEDEMNVSANAAEVKGYYQVLEAVPSSSLITLNNVPAGKYNKATFTIGIEEDGIAEGAAGGILDPAEGAWFWNWNAGYIGFRLEGTAVNSPAVPGPNSVQNGFKIHIGGWKDVPAATPGGPVNFVNNMKQITIDFGTDITVTESMEPNAHINVDIKKLLDEATVDFETTYAVHSPIKGQPIANKLSTAFILDHVHQ
jgi:hypothetical protein